MRRKEFGEENINVQEVKGSRSLRIEVHSEVLANNKYDSEAARNEIDL
jgi:hypothetical protein